MGRTVNLKHWVVILAILVSASPAGADTITVGPGGGYDYSTIQEGINAASNGDTVIVADGTYTGANNKNLSFGDKSLTVCSENGPENCIIDCEGGGRGFLFNNDDGADWVVSGFTIRNGNPGSGGGISCANSIPTITDCIISSCNANGWGGGIYCYFADPNITDCIISSCSATAYSVEDDPLAICPAYGSKKGTGGPKRRDILLLLRPEHHQLYLYR